MIFCTHVIILLGGLPSVLFWQIEYYQYRLDTAVVTIACSCCWNQHPSSMLMTFSQKQWPSKILADSEILSDFMSRTSIVAYSCLCVLSLLTHPHYKVKVSTKACPRLHPSSPSHTGSKTTTLEEESFVQLLGYLISCSFDPEKGKTKRNYLRMIVLTPCKA